jgi:hypothetical protein
MRVANLPKPGPLSVATGKRLVDRFTAKHTPGAYGRRLVCEKTNLRGRSQGAAYRGRVAFRGVIDATRRAQIPCRNSSSAIQDRPRR